MLCPVWELLICLVWNYLGTLYMGFSGEFFFSGRGEYAEPFVLSSSDVTVWRGDPGTCAFADVMFPASPARTSTSSVLLTSSF